MAEQVDALILGSGQAGNPLASALAGEGKRVVMVESKHVGGTCVNEGCTPTKTMISSARAAYQARRALEYGVHTGEVTVNMAEVRDRKRRVVDVWRSGSEKRLQDSENIELVRGLGRFTDERTVEVALNAGGTRSFTAPLIFINTGLRSLTPPGMGLEAVPYLTNDTVMELDTVPRRLLVLGGSYIAVEFAQMFRRFGAEVTIVSNASQLLPREDQEVGECLGEIFREDGIEVILNGKATAASKTANGVSLTVEVKDSGGKTSTRTLEGSHLLLAAGRTPNTDTLNLAAAGLEADGHGFIHVNERLETGVPGIYVLGDAKGGPAFTHISYDDYRIVSTNLLESGNRTTNDRPVPYTVFTDPELGRIGLTETDARKAGHAVRIAKMPASSIARAYETGEERGLVKIVVDRESEQILGAAILAGEGGEMMAVVQTAMIGKLPYTMLRDAVWAHPTWAEAFNNIFFKLEE